MLTYFGFGFVLSGPGYHALPDPSLPGSDQVPEGGGGLEGAGAGPGSGRLIHRHLLGWICGFMFSPGA